MTDGERVEGLLDALSRDELMSLALADWSPLERLGLPPFVWSDGGNGVRDAEGATAFPVSLALAATFDADLATAYGAAIGDEVRAAGRNALLGPAVDLARNPRAGRLAEAFGEDPWLAGHLASAHVRGVQSRHVVAVVKHLVANNFERLRTGDGPRSARRDAVDIRVDERTLHELYLAPFRDVLLGAGAWGVMGSYNRLNGDYACQNPALIAVLKQQWRWPGFVLPDFMHAVRDPYAALGAGLDVPGLDGAAGRTPEMLQDISDDVLRDMARRLLAAQVSTGLGDHPLEPAAQLSTPAHRDVARRVAEASLVLLRNDGTLPLSGTRRLAVIGPSGLDAVYVVGGSGGVSLDVERVVTPLDGIRHRAGADVEVVAAQGSLGDVRLPLVPADAWSQADGSAGVLVEYFDGRELTTPAQTRVDPTLDAFGAPDGMADEWSARWSGRLTPPATGSYRLSLLMAGEARLFLDGTLVVADSHEATRFFVGPEYPLQVVVDLEQGVAVEVVLELTTAAALIIPPLGVLPGAQLGWQPPDRLLDEAVQLAQSADVAVVVVQQASGEGMDRASLSLPGDQDRLVTAVAAANPRTVVVLNTPGPVLMPWCDAVAAVVQAWYPGEQFGAALAAVLFGDRDPGGRLPVTFPAAPGDGVPTDADHALDGGRVVAYDEGRFVGYRWFDARGRRPLFPFGYGLSYATFAVSDPLVEADDDSLALTCRVGNTSTRAGTAVVQLYLSGPAGSDQPQVALRGVAKLSLDPGAEATAVLRVDRRAVSTFDPAVHDWVVVPGRWTARVGWSSRDLPLACGIDVGPDGGLYAAGAAER